jgi:hypothetical protein
MAFGLPESLCSTLRFLAGVSHEREIFIVSLDIKESMGGRASTIERVTEAAAALQRLMEQGRTAAKQ